MHYIKCICFMWNNFHTNYCNIKNIHNIDDICDIHLIISKPWPDHPRKHPTRSAVSARLCLSIQCLSSSFLYQPLASVFNSKHLNLAIVLCQVSEKGQFLGLEGWKDSWQFGPWTVDNGAPGLNWSWKRWEIGPARVQLSRDQFAWNYLPECVIVYLQCIIHIVHWCLFCY